MNKDDKIKTWKVILHLKNIIASLENECGDDIRGVGILISESGNMVDIYK